MIFLNPREKFDQSDIFKNIYFYSKDETREGVLVTPICDIVQEEAEYLTFCGIYKFSEFLNDSYKNLGIELKLEEKKLEFTNLSKNKQEAFRGVISKLKANFTYPRYHWIDPDPGQQECRIIDFHLISSILIDEVKEKYSERLFSLSSPFREQIPVRFSSYMARVGVPKLANFEEIVLQASKDFFAVLKNK